MGSNFYEKKMSLFLLKKGGLQIFLSVLQIITKLICLWTTETLQGFAGESASFKN